MATLLTHLCDATLARGQVRFAPHSPDTLIVHPKNCCHCLAGVSLSLSFSFLSYSLSLLHSIVIVVFSRAYRIESLPSPTK